MFSQDCRNFLFFEYSEAGPPPSFMLIGHLYLFFYGLLFYILWPLKIVYFNNSSHQGSALVKCQWDTFHGGAFGEYRANEREGGDFWVALYLKWICLAESHLEAYCSETKEDSCAFSPMLGRKQCFLGLKPFENQRSCSNWICLPLALLPRTLLTIRTAWAWLAKWQMEQRREPHSPWGLTLRVWVTSLPNWIYTSSFRPSFCPPGPHPFFNTYLLSSFHVPGSVLGVKIFHHPHPTGFPGSAPGNSIFPVQGKRLGGARDAALSVICCSSSTRGFFQLYL